MSTVRLRGEAIRKYIIDNIEAHPSDIAKMAAEKFGLTRQAVNKHLQNMVTSGAIKSKSGKTRNRQYELTPLAQWTRLYSIGSPGVVEDVVWRNDVRPILVGLPDNVLDIWEYCFTEMFNNAIDHSAGTMISVFLDKTAASTKIAILDNGVGIFKKIQSEMNLLDERQAILELAKGKLTTDPRRHTGEGVFFTSRMLDSFDILSGGVFFTHQFGDDEDWIVERSKPDDDGTFVIMKLHNHTARTSKEIFDSFSGGDNYGFVKTVVPVKLAQYGNDKLISRSQAKRLLTRVEQFKIVIFDFNGVEFIGQAFADEIFRVFANSHPEMALLPANANREVQHMIERAKAIINTETTDRYPE
ncbi:MAG: ArsR family transcriptional regulator [Acidobacteria bacterium]|nr:MAG: ArsR family transcriptional regulator [Acidobacteriota bacterium]